MTRPVDPCPDDGDDGSSAAVGPLAVRLRGRILVPGDPEAACMLAEVAGREARFATTSAGAAPRGPCGVAVAYLEFVGRIEGPATCMGEGRIVVNITATEGKLARLTRQFAILARMPAAHRDELRGHRRIAIDVPEVNVLLESGIAVPGRIRDLSRSGAAVEVALPVLVGEWVTLGMTRGRVARTIEGGFAVQFARLLPLEKFGSAIRL